MGRPCGRSKISDFNGFRDSQCIVKLDAEIPDRAINIGVTKE
ncbi:hypothetical protein thalar_00825 [Litoreibacter arenae DSM 19593]|uniref:Uncharacterized protein n=1 Tax=Litoreibacter arenae DSM 19593 TaxID=1123360 RepID=S9RRI0_9RHOB|nr:hypothetical protein thalar_00825 [Litoreibacter arenae DSM 19593]